MSNTTADQGTVRAFFRSASGIVTHTHGMMMDFSGSLTAMLTPTRWPGMNDPSGLGRAKYRSTVPAIGLADGGAAAGRAGRVGAPGRAVSGPTFASLASSSAASPTNTGTRTHTGSRFVTS